MFLRMIYSVCVEQVSNEALQGYRFSFLSGLPWLLIYGRILISPEILYGYPRLKIHPKQEYGLLKINEWAWIYDPFTIADFQTGKLQLDTKSVVLSYIFDLEQYVQKYHPFRN